MIKVMPKIVKRTFENFDVYQYEDNNTFIYADFNDKYRFLDGLTDYILSEDNLLNYAHRISKVTFTPTKKNYIKLYKNIGAFLNSELETLTVDDVTDEIRTILGEEYKLTDNKGKLTVQKDKIGKIGEYIFHILLTNYFQLDCIIPKFRCTTDRNMSVFGIDTLFFNSSKNMIFFGESKVCNSLSNGITLVNRSLLDYENQISEEYRIVLSDTDVFIKSPIFMDIFEEHASISISFDEFIKNAHITDIGIPIFIAHGDCKGNTAQDFLNSLKNGIQRREFFGLDTKYIAISFPIVNKTDFVKILIRKLVNKSNEYGKEANAI